jgi:DNA repair exonuclease SbcCD nuclease subunit
MIVYGNHDAANEITKRLRPPDNVTVFPHEEATTVEPPGVGIAFHGRSYPGKVVNEDFSATYPPAVSGMLNVGILHTSLSGHEGPHARYAPSTETGLADRGYNYWALGHIHERYQTQRDGTWIVYPGNLQGRKSNEAGAKGATLVSYEDDRVTAVEHRTLDVVRWVVCEVSVDHVR